jgi:hypothetical protein
MYMVACGLCSLTPSADDVRQHSVQLPCSQHFPSGHAASMCQHFYGKMKKGSKHADHLRNENG